MKIRLASPLQLGSVVDGTGVRAIIWTQGCSHNCYGCHNPETHDLEGGFLTDTAPIKEEIFSLSLENGITFSGGDPMLQAEACLDIARFARGRGLNIWCYTGFTYEQLLNMSKKKPEILEFLKEIDVLVDGKFIASEKSLNLKFRGSRNQRIIDVQKSIKEEKVVLVNELMKEDDNLIITKIEKELFI